MAFIRAKQIKLNAAGDLLIGGVDGQGVVLPKGIGGQVLRATDDSLEFAALTAETIAYGEASVAETLDNLITSTTFTPIDNGVRSITGTTMQGAIAQAVGRAAVTEREATAAPTVTDDSTKGYEIGDFWLFNGQLYVVSDVTAGAAVWTRVDSGAATNVFTYKGTLDAATATEMPADPATGDVYRITASGNFGGTGPAVNAGDFIVAVVTEDETTWEVIDNSRSEVSGTSNRISVNGNTDLGFTVDIAADYVGQASITTLGTITTGTWNGTVIAPEFGGTGLDALGEAGQFLSVNATGDGLEYAYVSALKDSAGADAVSVVGVGAAAKAVATNATVTADTANTLATKGYVDSLVASGGTQLVDEDFVVPATPGANYSFDIGGDAIGAVSVFFNGVKLTKTGFTVAEGTVTLVDSVNGYAADEGDVLSVSYLSLVA